MESTDFLVRLTNDFYLGNYFEVLEGFKDYRESTLYSTEPLLHFQILLLSHKSMIHAIRNCEQEIPKYQSLFADQIPLLEIFLKYYAPILMSISTEEASTLLTQLISETNPGNLSTSEFSDLLIWLSNHLNFALKDYQKLARTNPLYQDLLFEFNAIVFSALEINNQHSDADRFLDDLRIVNEEHIVTNLLSIQKEMRNSQFDSALDKISELKERFGDSVKLSVLRASCLIAQLRFDEVNLLGWVGFVKSTPTN